MAKNNRITQLQKQLKPRSLDAVLITHIPHVRYLSGFSGSAGQLLVTSKKATFFTDFRYEQQAAQELADGIDAVIDKTPMKRMNFSCGRPYRSRWRETLSPPL